MTRPKSDRLRDDYILRCLNSDYLFYVPEAKTIEQRADPRAALPPPTNFVIRHLLQLYWTITKLAGLGHLHEAKVVKEQEEESVLDERTRLGEGDLRYVIDFVPWCRAAPPNVTADRILLDVTTTFLYGRTTGIQRVTREVTKFAMNQGLAMPVVLDDDIVFKADLQTGGLQPLEILGADRLFLLDSTWIERLGVVQSAVRRVKSAGGRIVVCIYDVLPLQYPALFTKGLASNYNYNLQQLASEVDGYITISKDVADALRSHLTMNYPETCADKRIEWTHLGADIVHDQPLGPVTDLMIRSLKSRRFFVCVGTVEPRKGHPIALEAFETLWANGADVALVIMGGRGWTMSAFEDRLAVHPERGRRLFRFDHVTDADLEFAYKHAQALIMPTLAEGFGLPAIEAARLGTPVIASDIPIMREVGGESFYYFDLLDTESLAATIEGVLEIEPSQRTVLRNILTWQQASQNVMRLARQMTTDCPSQRL